MQAIIMAAGKGTRLSKLTGNAPKSFIELKGKKLIDININMLRKHGIKEIVIVTGYRAEMFESLYGGDSGITIKYNPFYEFTNVIGSFYMGMNELHDDFIYLHADTLCDPSILDELLHSDSDITLPIDSKSCDEEAMKVKTEGGKVRYISKQIDPNVCDGEFIGIAKIKKCVLPLLKAKTISLLQRGAYSEYFEAAIQLLLDDECISVETTDTKNRFWAEIDYLEDYEYASKIVPKNLCDF